MTDFPGKGKVAVLKTSPETILEDIEKLMKLADFEGTVFVSSHDRYFLDRVVSRIVELDGGALTEYIGNYSDYQAEK